MIHIRRLAMEVQPTIALVLAESLVLAAGSGSGHRVWFWLQGLVLAEGLALAEVFNIFYKLLILVK
jgi:hypothetical protein